jgi:hypothetical protein
MFKGAFKGDIVPVDFEITMHMHVGYQINIDHWIPDDAESYARIPNMKNSLKDLAMAIRFSQGSWG